MANAQLRLVQDAPPGFQADTRDATRLIFDHWLFMLGRSPRRCKLGPTRRAAINGAMAMGYDADMLMMAVEGMAADPLDGAKDDHMRDAMREIEWLLAREARIERWADRGEALRLQVIQADQPAPDDAQPAPPVDEVAAAAARERLRQLGARSRAGQHV
jgi:hypothetical protein